MKPDGSVSWIREHPYFAGCAGDQKIPPPRALSFDERAAAETAYQNRPPNPAWSRSALQIYVGMRSVLPLTQRDGR